MTYPEQPPQDPRDPGQQPMGYGQQPPAYGQPVPPYGQQSSTGYFAPPPPKHPSATVSMILGIVGLAGVLALCGVTLPVSPFAWYFGAKAVKEIDAQPGRYSGRSEANAGKITGIIGTVLLILAIVAIGGFIALAALSAPASTGPSYGSNS